MRFLITGITGFAATHLAERLQAGGHEVFGTTRGLHDARRLHEARLTTVPADHVLVASVTDRQRLAALIRDVAPDGVFHLAAQSNVTSSFDDPEETYRVNLFGTLNVFAGVQAAALPCRVVYVGSSAAYGEVPAEALPISEDVPFRPLSPYAVSKAAADLAAFQWSRTQGLDVVRVRPFNHTGPGQSAEYFCSGLARQVVEIERGKRPARIAAGNLDVQRDFIDVRDVAAAYVLAFERGERGEAYNVCRGAACRPREIIAALLQISGVSATIEVHAERQRSADVPTSIGSAAKLQRVTEWRPQISWEQTLCDLLADWRARSV